MERMADLLHMAGSHSRNMVLITADTGHYLKTQLFERDFGERLFNYGNAPQNAVVAAAGFAIRGKAPIVGILAKDLPLVYEQLKNSVCRSNLNVKILGALAGLSAGSQGCSFQSFDDVALMRILPNMKIYCPSNIEELGVLMKFLQDDYGPAYIRLPLISEEGLPFEGEEPLDYGNDIALLSYGTTVRFCADAIKVLRELGIRGRYVNIVTINPIDREPLIRAAKSCKVIVTVEDHSIFGGLGGAVSEILCEEYPRDMFRIGIEDVFGGGGSAQDLYAKHGLTGQKIAEKVYGWWRELGYH